MRALAFTLVLVPALLLMAPPRDGHAEDGWRVHPLGADGLELPLPEAWTVLVDDLGGQLIARSHDAPQVRLVASRRQADPDTPLADVRDQVLDGLFGAPGESAETEDEAEQAVDGRPSLWTLVAYETEAGPRRSLLVVRADVSLRFDFAAGAFAARRGLIVRIANGLAAEAVEAAEDVAEMDAAETAAQKPMIDLDLLQEFMTRVPRTRADLADLAKTLGQEEGLDQALDVLDELVETAGPMGKQMLELVGWRRFHHDVPDGLRYRGHDFVRAVEQANEQRWFGPDESGSYERARRAWAETKRHAERIENEHGARAADQKLANLEHDPALEGLSFVTYSAPPFLLVCPVKAPASGADASDVDAKARAPDLEAITSRLEREGRRLSAVYRTFLREYGDLFDLADLAAPYGGRPDLKVGSRSFADGMVLVVLLPPNAEAAQAMLGDRRASRALGLPRIRPDGTLVLAPEENLAATATLGARQLLLAFTRQRSMWGQVRPVFSAVLDAFALQFGSRRESADGSLAIPSSDPAPVAMMRSRAKALADREVPYPVLALRKLAALDSVAAGVEELVRFDGVPPEVAPALLFDQTAALGAFLMEAENGRWRPAFLRVVRAGLDRQLGRGMKGAAFMRAFELSSDADWAELETAWERFIREDRLGGGTAAKTDAPTKGTR